jgi:hypothetical protein
LGGGGKFPHFSIWDAGECCPGFKWNMSSKLFFPQSLKGYEISSYFKVGDVNFFKDV